MPDNHWHLATEHQINQKADFTGHTKLACNKLTLICKGNALICNQNAFNTFHGTISLTDCSI